MITVEIMRGISGGECEERTIGCHDEEDNNCKRPFELDGEHNKSDNDIDENWNDIEQQQLGGCQLTA